MGLATVAATTRSSELAEEVKILARIFRHRAGGDIAPQQALKFVMVTAAAYSDSDLWCKSVGEWLTELAFEDMSRESAFALAQHLQTLCQIEPKLWETCGRAVTACIAFATSVAA
jgi:hypothetical protein